MKERINTIKKLMETEKATKGCVALYPDRIKEMAVIAHKDSKMSQAEFSRQLEIAPQTLKKWIDYIGEIPNKRPGAKSPIPKKESNFKISMGETRESYLAKKKLYNKSRFEKKIIKSDSKKVEIAVPKKEIAEDIKVYLERSINKAIPVVRTRGDFIPQKFRDMQTEWLSKNKPKQYVNGILIED